MFNSIFIYGCGEFRGGGLLKHPSDAKILLYISNISVENGLFSNFS